MRTRSTGTASRWPIADADREVLSHASTHRALPGCRRSPSRASPPRGCSTHSPSARAATGGHGRRRAGAHAEIQRKIRADALLYPSQQAAIVPKIAAPVKRLYVKRGARVRRRPAARRARERRSRAAVAESQAAYEQAEAEYQTAARATLPEETQKAELDVRAAKEAMDAQQAVFDSRQAVSSSEGAIAQKDVNDAQVGSDPGAQPVRNRAASTSRICRASPATGAQGAQPRSATRRKGTPRRGRRRSSPIRESRARSTASSPIGRSTRAKRCQAALRSSPSWTCRRSSRGRTIAPAGGAPS